MKIHTIHQQQEVPVPLAEVFPFFETPSNLETITPPRLRMDIITPGKLEMRVGALFDYIVSVRGLPMRWTTYIADYDPPYRFVDVQLRGPYAFWHHTHDFRETDRGTVIEDTVRYALPFGPLGSIAHALFVKNDLDHVFSFRRKVIADTFGAVTAERAEAVAA